MNVPAPNTPDRLKALLWKSRDWRQAVRMALLIGDDDSLTALLALEEASTDATEGFAWCNVHGLFHEGDGCAGCAKDAWKRDHP